MEKILSNPDTDKDTQPDSSGGNDVSKKLEAIAAESPLELKVEGRRHNLYAMRPGPILPGLRFALKRGRSDLHIWEMGLDDTELQQRGIGSLMMAAAVQHSLEIAPNLSTISKNQGNLAFIKTLGKVAGVDSLSFTRDGTAYGRDGELSAEKAWENHNPEERFVVGNILAFIDTDRISTIDIPVQLDRLAETGRTGLWTD
jgi:hypothetical protein